MSAAHTPGPWSISLEDDGGFVVYTPPTGDMGWNSVVTSRGQWGHNDEQSHANGRLIAAAPDLLEALQNLDANPELTSAWLQARAAIAKATGVAQ